MSLIVGIDPGKTSGAICWKCTITGEYDGVRMPETAKQAYDLLRGLQSHYGPLIASIEQVQVMGKSFGAKAALSYGQHYGELIGILTSLKAQIHEVRPSVWKRKLNISSDKQTSILLCERMFPELELKPGRCTKAQDGLAEAMLLVKYWEVNNG